MLSQEKVLSLVGRIYDAAADVRLWPAFLEDFADAVDGTTTGLIFYDWSASDAKLDVSVRYDPAYARQYVQHYYSVNPWTQAWKKRWNCAGPETIEAGDENVELALLEKTEFYNDYLLPQSDAHQMGCMLTKTDQTFAAFTCMRRRKTGAFGPDELDLLRLLFPHLQRAVTFRRKVAELEGRYHASLDALDRLPTGVILLDGSGRTVATNREADRVLRQNDGLLASSHGIRASRPDDTQELRGMIAGAARTAKGEGTGAGGLLALTRPSGKRPLTVLVAPVGRNFFATDVKTPSVILFVTDPEHKVESLAGALARLYNLTTAESRVAELLMQGETAVRAAERLGVSHNTARTHLQRIYRKTGTMHQGELVRLLLAGPARLSLSEVTEHLGTCAR